MMDGEEEVGRVKLSRFVETNQKIVITEKEGEDREIQRKEVQQFENSKFKLVKEDKERMKSN